MKAVITIYDDDRTAAFSKRTYPLTDEADIEQKKEDIADFLLDQIHELEERVGI